MLLVAAALSAVRLRGLVAPTPALADGATGVTHGEPVLDHEMWSERIRDEASRCGRYERLAAVVVIRLESFDELVAASAAMDGHRLGRAIVASLRRSARDSDVVYGDGSGTFRVLLVEADDFGARAYVDRVSQVLRPWIETIDAEVGLTATWAGTSGLTDLAAADRLAEARLVGAADGWIRSASVRRLRRGPLGLVPDLPNEPFADRVPDEGGRAPGPELLG
jgi:GGDEF domain-containing protein